MDMDLEQKAIMRLREAADTSERFYKAPLIVTTSGGKDSSVCVALAEKAGIEFEVMHNHTTVDAPETVYFVRREFKRLEEKGIKCTVNYPHYKGERVTMWSLIPQKLMPPTRLVRYCCSILKERGGQGRYITTGVRWAESTKRKNNRGIYETMPSDPRKKIVLNNDNDDRRRLFETCMRQHTAVDRLERIYGAAFYEIFKTITVDNGSEFADADGIERSARRKDAKRTTVYYCHAYSSCERGTNENINRMIRRQFPKGTDFDKVTAAEVKRVETWLNNYPREILGFMSSAQAFELAFDRAA